MFNQEKDIILNSINEGVFTVDHDWKITSFNKAAEKITGINEKDALGKSCKDIFKSSICEKGCAIKQTIESKKPITGKVVTILNSKGSQIPISISTAMLKNKKGKIIGGVEIFRDLTMIEKLRRDIQHEYTFEDIISKNHKMYDIFSTLPQIAESNSTVLIEGESGTGKELFARAIHNLSFRKKKPFIAVNCGALPDNLLESELFGYKSGAFTDAKKDKPGRIALAEGGTLFLDEIGDISNALQVRLLRFLQEKVYEPLGAIKSLKANVRIVAATNKNLSRLVELEKFRQDLFYRINVILIKLPPLKDRMGDIPLLIESFLARLTRIQGKEVLGISGDALASLMMHDFPGNIRELENIIERAFVLCNSGRIEQKNLPEPFCSNVCKEYLKKTSHISFKQLEASFYMDSLKHNNWSRIKTARQLGIHKTTLFRKIKSLGLKLPDLKKSSLS